MAKPLPIFVLLPQAMYFKFLDALKELEQLKLAGGGVGNRAPNSTADELQASGGSEVAEMGGGGIINDLPQKLNPAPGDFNDTPAGASEFVRKEVGEPKKKKREEQLEGQGGTTAREDHPAPWFYLGPGPF